MENKLSEVTLWRDFKIVPIKYNSSNLPVKYNPDGYICKSKRQWFAKQKVVHDLLYTNNTLPPMTIEPSPHNRQNLPFKVTPSDRAVRQQWLIEHAVEEPVYFKEDRPKNIFRRMWRSPFLNFADRVVLPLMGKPTWWTFKRYAPPVGFVLFSLHLIHSYVFDEGGSWERAYDMTGYEDRVKVVSEKPLDPHFHFGKERIACKQGD